VREEMQNDYHLIFDCFFSSFSTILQDKFRFRRISSDAKDHASCLSFITILQRGAVHALCISFEKSKQFADLVKLGVAADGKITEEIFVEGLSEYMKSISETDVICRMWVNFIELVNAIVVFKKATREGENELMDAIFAFFLPVCIRTGRKNYAILFFKHLAAKHLRSKELQKIYGDNRTGSYNGEPGTNCSIDKVSLR
jgi:hypothetical protein